MKRDSMIKMAISSMHMHSLVFASFTGASGEGEHGTWVGTCFRFQISKLAVV